MGLCPSRYERRERDADETGRARPNVGVFLVPVVYLVRPPCFVFRPHTYDEVREDEAIDGRMDGRANSWLTRCFRDGFVGVVDGRREARANRASVRVYFWGAEETRTLDCGWKREREQGGRTVCGRVAGGVRCGWSSSLRMEQSAENQATTCSICRDDGRRSRSSKYSARRQPPNNGDRDNYCNYRRNSRRERESGKDIPGVKPRHFDANLSSLVAVRATLSNAPSCLSLTLLLFVPHSLFGLSSSVADSPCAFTHVRIADNE